jgi:hypothetical protein
VERHSEDATTLELMSLRELMTPQPSITATTRMTVPPADMDHYEDYIEDDSPTQMNQIPSARGSGNGITPRDTIIGHDIRGDED